MLKTSLKITLPKTLPQTLSLVLVCAIAVVGCSDPEAAQNAGVRDTHQKVAHLLAEAQLPYVPGNQSIAVGRSDIRQNLQIEAQAELQAILKEGTPSQQIATRRLAADIYDSAARKQLNRVTSNWTELSNQSALLLSYLQAVDRADSQFRRFSGDQTKLIASMRTQTDTMQKQSDDFKKELAAVESKAKELSTKVDSSTTQTQKHISQAASLREKAFSQTGVERYQSYEKAAEAAIKSNKFSAELQILQAQLGVTQSNAKILARQLELSDEAVAQAQTQIKSIIASQTEQAQLKNKAQQTKQTAVDKLDAELGTMVTAYKKLTDEGFGPALSDINKAIELLDGTLALATEGDARRNVQLDLLARKLSKLNILSIQASAAGDWARKLQVVAGSAGDAKRPGGAMVAGKSTFYDTTSQAATNQHGSIAAEALRTASEANDLAAQLAQSGSEGDDITKHAASLASLIEIYTKQINASKP